MEGNKQKGICSSSTSELFGSKQFRHPSSGIFGSIYSPPPTKVIRRENICAGLNGKMANESLCSKTGIQDNGKMANENMCPKTGIQDNGKMPNESFCSKIGIQDNTRAPNESWCSKIGIRDDCSIWRECRAKYGVYNDTSSIYQEQRVTQPCQLSSSIYYGGQDFYITPPSAKNNSLYNNDGEDDREYATRGDWWQGSLYY